MNTKEIKSQYDTVLSTGKIYSDLAGYTKDDSYDYTEYGTEEIRSYKEDISTLIENVSVFLTDKQKQIAIAKYVNNLRVKDISDMLGIYRNSIDHQLERIDAKLNDFVFNQRLIQECDNGDTFDWVKFLREHKSISVSNKTRYRHALLFLYSDIPNICMSKISYLMGYTSSNKVSDIIYKGMEYMNKLGVDINKPPTYLLHIDIPDIRNIDPKNIAIQMGLGLGYIYMNYPEYPYQYVTECYKLLMEGKTVSEIVDLLKLSTIKSHKAFIKDTISRYNKVTAPGYTPKKAINRNHNVRKTRRHKLSDNSKGWITEQHELNINDIHTKTVDNCLSKYHNNALGKICICKDDVLRVVTADDLPKYLEDGWKRGMPEKSAALRRNTIEINKDGKTIRVKESELKSYLRKGWKRGRIYTSIEKGSITLYNYAGKKRIVRPDQLDSYLFSGYTLNKPLVIE